METRGRAPSARNRSPVPSPPLPPSRQIPGSPRIRAAILLDHEERLLLVRHCKAGRSYWLLPGGGVEHGETAAEAARREAREETGLEVSVGDLCLVAETLSPDRSRHLLHLVFRARWVGGELRVGAEERLAEARFTDLEQLEGLTLHPPLTRALIPLLRRPTATPEPLYLGPLWSD